MMPRRNETTPDSSYLQKPNPFIGIEKDLTVEGLFTLAVWFQNCDEIDKAIDCYRTAIDRAPRFVEAYYNLGILHFRKKEWSVASYFFRKALDFKSDFGEAAINLAAALRFDKKYEAAAAVYQKSIQLAPNRFNAHFGLGLCLQNLDRPDQAVTCFQKAVSLNPQHADAWFRLGESYINIKPMEEILYCFSKAVELQPAWPAGHHNLATALSRLHRLEGAIQHAQQALELSPDFSPTYDLLFRLAQHACDWQLTYQAGVQLDQLTSEELRNGLKTSENPMINIRRKTDPHINLEVARSWSRHIADSVQEVKNSLDFRHNHHPVPRIRIGYLSSDFKDHAVAHQIRGMLAAHDRRQFEVFGYACNPDDGTRYRRLLSESCDVFRELHDLTDSQAAQQIYDDGIHILVDLSGHSRDNRMPVVALRPAPLQVSYLGFLSSTGADFIDYVIADTIVVPPDHQPSYSEKVVYLPHCYQANDDLMPIADRTYHRSECNLPVDGKTVFCCFNQPYKIDEALFDVWLNILKRVDGSVLWLLERSTLARKNLYEAAKQADIDPERLVFTGFLPIEHHLSRLRLADIVLDTRLYNGGATTANALWAGVPLITVLGNHWVSRMSASALHAIGLPELVAHSLEEYEHLAISLGLDPIKRDALRKKLAAQRETTPLFNTRLFTRHLETAFASMWQRYCAGLAPVSFNVKD